VVESKNWKKKTAKQHPGFNTLQSICEQIDIKVVPSYKRERIVIDCNHSEPWAVRLCRIDRQACLGFSC